MYGQNINNVETKIRNEDKKWIDISAVTQKNVDKLKEIISNIFQNDISQNGDKVGVKTYEN